MEAARRMYKAVGDETALYGLFCGPFTLASHLRGTKLFMDMKKNPEQVKKLMAFCVKQGKAMIDMYAEAGCCMIAPSTR